MYEEREEFEPCEGDYTMTPAGHLGSLIAVAEIGGKFLGTFNDSADAMNFILGKMGREKYFPNVWNVSDHGNWSLAR